MKKKLLLTLLILLLPIATFAQSYFKVKLEKPGTLEASIPEERLETMKVLCIEGPMNGTDFKFLHEILHCDYKEEPDYPNIISLNLSNAQIVAGGEAYRTKIVNRKPLHLYTKNDTVSEELFFGFREIRTLKLPKTTKYIGNGALFNLAVPSMEIPSEVTGLGNAALQWCENMNTVTFKGNKVEHLGKLCFAFCDKLEKINLPKSIKTIAPGCFAHCSRLKDIKLPELLTVIDSSIFYNCKAFNSIIVPKNVKSINKSAFEYSSVRRIKLPEGLESIEPRAFYGCQSLTSILIPKTCYNIMDASFSGCFGLEQGIPVSEENPFYSTIDGSLFSADSTIMYQLKADPKIVEYTIPSKVKEIAPFALGYSFYLKRVNIPENVKMICANGLYFLMKLEEIHIDSKKPIDLGGPTAFDFSLKSDATLFVPDGTESLYMSTPVWNEFKNIVGETSSIKEIPTDKIYGTEEIGRYDLKGHLLTKPTKGFQIIRYRDGRGVKVYVD